MCRSLWSAACELLWPPPPPPVGLRVKHGAWLDGLAAAATPVSPGRNATERAEGERRRQVDREIAAATRRIAETARTPTPSGQPPLKWIS